MYVPVCQLGSLPAVRSTENESHQVAPTLSLSTIDSARTQKESQISPETTNSKPTEFARKNEKNDKFVAKPGSSKSNEIQDADKKRKSKNYLLLLCLLGCMSATSMCQWEYECSMRKQEARAKGAD